MTLAFTILFVLNCLFLVLVVLLQAGRGGGLSIAGGGGGGSTQVFGASGGATFLQKLTVASAAAFMILSMILARLSSSHSGVSDVMFVDPDEPAGQELVDPGAAGTAEPTPIDEALEGEAATEPAVPTEANE